MAWPSVYRVNVRDLDDPGGAAQTEKPVILIVHGAFHTVDHFHPLMTRLTQAGFRVLIPQLPSSSFTPQPNALEADVRAITQSAQLEIDRGRNIVLVAHGYGAIPGCVAAYRINQVSLDRPRTGHITKQALIAGVVLEPGESYNDVLEHSWAVERSGLVAVRNPGSVFVPECPVNIQDRHVSLLRPQTANAFTTEVGNPGWQSSPTLYIICELDQVIPAADQQNFVRILHAANSQVRAISLQCGHCPFISCLNELSTILIRYAS